MGTEQIKPTSHLSLKLEYCFFYSLRKLEFFCYSNSFRRIRFINDRFIQFTPLFQLVFFLFKKSNCKIPSTRRIRISLPSARIWQIRQRIRIFLNPLFRVEKITCNESDNVWTGKLGYFSYRTIKRYGDTTCRPGFSRVNPDTVGSVWTGEFNFHTLLWMEKFLNPERNEFKQPITSKSRRIFSQFT